MDQLLLVQNRYKMALEAVELMKDDQAAALVPLTDSIFVNARVSNDEFLIDIGTDYYIKQNRDEAIRFYKEKVLFIQQQISSLEQLIATQQINQQFQPQQPQQ